MRSGNTNAKTRTEHYLRLSPGTILEGRYEIMSELGAGGFAVVYDGRDLRMNRTVAIKVLNLLSLMHNTEQMEKALERFRREAQLAASINHPNVVAIYGSGTTDDYEQPYIVMERLQGHSLSQECQRHGVVEPARLLPLLDQCLAGLATAHAQNIVHRDLKPSNLFLHQPRSREERMYLVDFGIAHLSGAHSDLTGTGHIFGTPRFLPPEYIMEQRITPALDVYQMGLILSETLTGVVAVRDEFPVACFFKHINGELRVSRTLMRTPLGEIICKALAPDPKDRYTNAEELRWALSHVDVHALPDLRGGPECTLREAIGSWEPLFHPMMGQQAGNWGIPGALRDGFVSHPETPARPHTPLQTFPGSPQVQRGKETLRSASPHALSWGEEESATKRSIPQQRESAALSWGEEEDATRRSIPKMPASRPARPVWEDTQRHGYGQLTPPSAIPTDYVPRSRTTRPPPGFRPSTGPNSTLPPERFDPLSQEMSLPSYWNEAEDTGSFMEEIAPSHGAVSLEELAPQIAQPAYSQHHNYAMAGRALTQQQTAVLPVQPRQVSEPAQEGRSGRRYFEVIAILGLLLALAGAVLIIVYALQSQQPPQPTPVRVTPAAQLPPEVLRQEPAAPSPSVVVPAVVAPPAATPPEGGAGSTPPQGAGGAALAALAAESEQQDGVGEEQPAQEKGRAPAPDAQGPVAVELQTQSQCKAIVKQGRKKLGYTPLRLEFDSMQEIPRNLRMRCKGHRTASVRVGPKDGPVLKIQMVPR